MQWQSVGCVTSLSYFVRIYVVLGVPAGLVLLIVLLFLAPSYRRDTRRNVDADSRRVALKRSRRKFWKLVLFVSLLPLRPLALYSPLLANLSPALAQSLMLLCCHFPFPCSLCSCCTRTWPLLCSATSSAATSWGSPTSSRVSCLCTRTYRSSAWLIAPVCFLQASRSCATRASGTRTCPTCCLAWPPTRSASRSSAACCCGATARGCWSPACGCNWASSTRPTRTRSTTSSWWTCSTSCSWSPSSPSSPHGCRCRQHSSPPSSTS